MQRSKSSRARSSFTHRKRQRTPSAVDPIPDAVAEHESPPVDMALPAAGAEKQPAVIGTLMQVAPLLWDNEYIKNRIWTGMVAAAPTYPAGNNGPNGPIWKQKSDSRRVSRGRALGFKHQNLYEPPSVCLSNRQ